MCSYNTNNTCPNLSLFDERYPLWYSNIIANCDSGLIQSEVLMLLFNELNSIQRLFSGSLEEGSYFLDLMCGPGDMTHHLKQTLATVLKRDITACGVDMLESHIKSWRKTMDEKDVCICLDINDCQPNELFEGKKFLATFIIHGCYYLYNGTPANPIPDALQQPKLLKCLRIAMNSLSPSGIGILIHLSKEYGDLVRSRFGTKVESDTDTAIHNILQQEQLDYATLSFQFKRYFPITSTETKKELTNYLLEDYNSMQSRGKETFVARNILEFMLAKRLEELGREEYELLQSSGEIHKKGADFMTFNQQKRIELVEATQLIWKHFGGIMPGFVDLIVLFPQEMKTELKEEVLKAMTSLQQKLNEKFGDCRLNEATYNTLNDKITQLLDNLTIITRVITE